MSLSLDSKVIEVLKAKRLIFTVSTGRSGTAFLNWVLDFLPGVKSLHEPEPEYVKVLRDVQRNRDLAMQFMCEQKLPAIAKESGNIYIETSHLFCKGFAEVTLDLGIVPDLVIHSRKKRDIAKSLFRGGTIPGRTSKALQFYLSPQDPNVLLLEDWELLNDYQLCYWYCLEIERRAYVYRNMFEERGALVMESTLETVKTFSGYLSLVKSLNLPRPNLITYYKFWRCRNFKMNVGKTKPGRTDLPENLSELEREIEQLVIAGTLSS